MSRLAGIVLAAALAFLPTSAIGVPIVSVDVDTAAAGVQSQREVVDGDAFTVAVLVADVAESNPLNAAEFDIGFDSSMLNPSQVVTGGFLVQPTILVESDLTPPDVNFAEATLGSDAVSGTGVLATVSFQSLAVGTTTLDLNDVILSAPFGEEISISAANDATLTIVPEPSVGALVGFGVLLLRVTRRTARHR